MADIVVTVDGMSKADLAPEKPPVTDPVVPTLTATKIKAIAKELVQPWKYGIALHRFARIHGVPLSLVREISEAVGAKKATFTVEEQLIAPEVGDK